ncbi:MAG: hypothetical protein ACRERC_12165, partial [Candidatus Binatia bacterium]
AGDSVPMILTPIAMLRGDGVDLARFAYLWPLWRGANTKDGHPYFVTHRRGEVVSVYPHGTSLLALPLVAAQMVVADADGRGWEQDRSASMARIMALNKNSAAALSALTGVCLFLLLRAQGFGWQAWAATLIAGLGSNLWMIASQSLWQHTGGALSFAAALALLAPTRVGRARLCAGGFATAAIAVCRLQAFLFPLGIGLAVLWRYRRASGWFLIGPIALGLPLLFYNYWYFGAAVGGFAALEPYNGPVHAVSGTWTSDVATGLLGTLVSPSHGLLVFSPWIGLALAALPAIGGRLPAVVRAALWMLIPFTAMLSAHATWWAGWSWGPRYWTDVMPLFGVVLGFALDWSWRRARPLCVALFASGAFAIAIQGLGSACYPCSWDSRPTNVNVDHARLWDWRDSVLTRSLADDCYGWGPQHAWNFLRYPFPPAPES